MQSYINKINFNKSHFSRNRIGPLNIKARKGNQIRWGGGGGGGGKVRFRLSRHFSEQIAIAEKL